MCSLVSIADHLVNIQKYDILTDIIAFICLIAFKLKVDRGESRATRLTKTIIHGGIHYFVVMAGFHITMLFLTVFDKVIMLLLLVGMRILTPWVPSLPLSLRSL